jgi:hypothetical protein
VLPSNDDNSRLSGVFLTIKDLKALAEGFSQHKTMNEAIESEMEQFFRLADTAHEALSKPLAASWSPDSAELLDVSEEELTSWSALLLSAVRIAISNLSLLENATAKRKEFLAGLADYWNLRSQMYLSQVARKTLKTVVEGDVEATVKAQLPLIVKLGTDLAFERARRWRRRSSLIGAAQAVLVLVISVVAMSVLWIGRSNVDRKVAQLELEFEKVSLVSGKLQLEMEQASKLGNLIQEQNEAVVDKMRIFREEVSELKTHFKETTTELEKASTKQIGALEKDLRENGYNQEKFSGFVALLNEREVIRANDRLAIHARLQDLADKVAGKVNKSKFEDLEGTVQGHSTRNDEVADRLKKRPRFDQLDFYSKAEVESLLTALEARLAKEETKKSPPPSGSKESLSPNDASIEEAPQ